MDTVINGLKSIQAQPAAKRLVLFTRPLLGDNLGLKKLPRFTPIIVVSYLFFSLINALAPLISSVLLPQTYRTYCKTPRAKANWAAHVTSQVHVLIIVPIALITLNSDIDKAWGWTDAAGYAHAITSGYFIWDTQDAIVNFAGLGFVFHGLFCLIIYAMSFRPFLIYFGSKCLLWETSTFFMNGLWFTGKIKAASEKPSNFIQRLEILTGLTTILTFFSIRLVWGSFVSYDFWKTFLSVYQKIEYPYYSIAFGNIILNVLNWFWFSKMVAMLNKRLKGDPKPASTTIKPKDKKTQ